MGKIGLFDSGVGGSTIWKAVVEELPSEETLFFADRLHAPYGNRSKEEIIELSRACTEYLLDNGCEIIVVACNTATTSAISELRKRYKVPFIGIEPAIKPASLNSKSKVVGVLATKGTLGSELFHKTKQLGVENGIEIVEQIGYGLVELIEKGIVDGEEMERLLRGYLGAMMERGIDYLVLGCTHYPYVEPVIRRILSENIMIIDSAEAVARHTRVVMQANGILADDGVERKHKWVTNKDVEVLRRFVPKGMSVEVEEV